MYCLGSPFTYNTADGHFQGVRSAHLSLDRGSRIACCKRFDPARRRAEYRHSRVCGTCQVFGAGFEESVRTPREASFAAGIC